MTHFHQRGRATIAGHANDRERVDPGDCVAAFADYGASRFPPNGPMADTADIEAPVMTPCTRVCVVHPFAGLCIGCGRSRDEIAGWIDFDDAARRRIMAHLPARLAALGRAPGAPPTA
jgi:hypothetical protein